MKLLSILLLVACVAAGCAYDDDPTYPMPTGPIEIQVATQTAPISTPCSAAELTPILITWDATHRSLSLGGEKAVMPAGFTGRMLPNGRFELLAPAGEVVARDGDRIKVGGADYMHICRVQGVNY